MISDARADSVCVVTAMLIARFRVRAPGSRALARILPLARRVGKGSRTYARCRPDSGNDQRRSSRGEELAAQRASLRAPSGPLNPAGRYAARFQRQRASSIAVATQRSRTGGSGRETSFLADVSDVHGHPLLARDLIRRSKFPAVVLTLLWRESVGRRPFTIQDGARRLRGSGQVADLADPRSRVPSQRRPVVGHGFSRQQRQYNC